MIAIQTRYLGPTNSAGSRYAAWVVGRPKTRVTLSADYALGLDANHTRAAAACLEKHLAAQEDWSRSRAFTVYRWGDTDDGKGNIYGAVSHTDVVIFERAPPASAL